MVPLFSEKEGTGSISKTQPFSKQLLKKVCTPKHNSLFPSFCVCKKGHRWNDECHGLISKTCYEYENYTVEEMFQSLFSWTSF